MMLRTGGDRGLLDSRQPSTTEGAHAVVLLANLGKPIKTIGDLDV